MARYFYFRPSISAGTPRCCRSKYHSCRLHFRILALISLLIINRHFAASATAPDLEPSPYNDFIIRYFLANSSRFTFYISSRCRAQKCSSHQHTYGASSLLSPRAEKLHAHHAITLARSSSFSPLARPSIPVCCFMPLPRRHMMRPPPFRARLSPRPLFDDASA